VNYDAEYAAKDGGGGEACVLQVVFFWRGLQGFYKQRDADSEGGGGSYVGSKHYEKFFIESFRVALGRYEGAKNDNDHSGDDGAEGGEVCELAVWRRFEGFGASQCGPPKRRENDYEETEEGKRAELGEDAEDEAVRVGDGFGGGGRFILRIKGREVSTAYAGEVMVEEHLRRGMPVLPAGEHRVAAGESAEFEAEPGDERDKGDSADDAGGKDDIFG